MLSEHRTSVTRDARLETEPVEVVACRYYFASAAGPTNTLAIVIWGLAIVGLVGGFMWATGGASMTPSRGPGVFVLLAGALCVGILAGFASPAIYGQRAIIISAVMIVSLPVVITGLLAVFGAGGDRAWGMELLALTSLGGAAMVGLTATGYALIRRSRSPGGRDGSPDWVAARVLDQLQGELERNVDAAAGGPVIVRAPDDDAGRARLELETRLLTDAGYVEIRRERVSVEAEPDPKAFTLVAPEPPPAQHSLEVAFDAGGPATDTPAAPRSPRFRPLPERPLADPLPSVPRAPAQDSRIADEATRWVTAQAAEGADVPDRSPDRHQLGGLVISFVALEALIAQVASLFELGSSPDQIQAVVGVVLLIVPPACVGGFRAYRRGAGSWPIAVVPLAAIVILVVGIGGGVAWGEVLGYLALAGAILTAPWAVGWLLGLAVRAVRGGPAHPH